MKSFSQHWALDSVEGNIFLWNWGALEKKWNEPLVKIYVIWPVQDITRNLEGWDFVSKSWLIRNWLIEASLQSSLGSSLHLWSHKFRELLLLSLFLVWLVPSFASGLKLLGFLDLAPSPWGAVATDKLPLYQLYIGFNFVSLAWENLVYLP